MLNEKSKKIIGEEILNLPKEVAEAIDSSNWENLAEEIGKNNSLSESEIETLQLETISFLLGLIDEDSYKENIENGIGTSKNEAEKIVSEILERILIPINKQVEENIKKNGKHIDTNAEENLNFILSGGDYSSFIEPTEPTLENTPINISQNNNNEEKANENNSSIPIKAKNIQDIRSKFTI